MVTERYCSCHAFDFAREFRAAAGLKRMMNFFLAVMQLIIATLEKETAGQWWTSALKGHIEIDLHTIPGYDPPPFDPTSFRM